MYKRPEVPVADRLISAIQANREAINTCKFGEVTVKVKDGIVYLVEVRATHNPGHYEYSGGDRIDGAWVLACYCGERFEGQTQDDARALLEQHTNDRR